MRIKRMLQNRRAVCLLVLTVVINLVMQVLQLYGLQPITSLPGIKELPIAAYREWVRRSTKRNRQCSSASLARATVLTKTVAEACFNQTTTKRLSLEYPEDADAHFNEIRLAMAPWAQHKGHRMHQGPGYHGPWIENEWITHFEKLYDQGEVCLAEHFGAFIPLFIPFVDLWIWNGRHGYDGQLRYNEGLVETLLPLLRPNVAYVIVSQNDEGIEGRFIQNELSFPNNVLILSAGGYGHVPVPLIKQKEELHNSKIESRSLGVSYVGSLDHAPNNLRDEMHKMMTQWNSTHGNKYQYYYGGKWRNVMRDSKFSLVPRGWGRSAYHLMETLQMGLIPIYVYSDIPWVPYEKLFADLGFVSTVSDLPLLLNELDSMPTEEIVERENRIKRFRESHFLVPGILNQIQRFLLGEASDLQCQSLPASVRDAD